MSSSGSSFLSIYVETIEGKTISANITLQESYGSDFLLESRNNSDEQIKEMLAKISSGKELLRVLEKSISEYLQSWAEYDSPSFYQEIEDIEDISELKSVYISEESDDSEDSVEREFVYQFVGDDSKSFSDDNAHPVIDGNTLIIPENVTEVDMEFLSEFGFSEIKVDPNNKFFAKASDESLCSKDGKTLYIYRGEWVGDDYDEIVIPDGYTAISEFAFWGQDMLEKVTLPESIENIGPYAFAYSSIKTILIPEAITQIDETAFYGCEELTIIRY